MRTHTHTPHTLAHTNRAKHTTDKTWSDCWYVRFCVWRRAGVWTENVADIIKYMRICEHANRTDGANEMVASILRLLRAYSLEPIRPTTVHTNNNNNKKLKYNMFISIWCGAATAPLRVLCVDRQSISSSPSLRVFLCVFFAFSMRRPQIQNHFPVRFEVPKILLHIVSELCGVFGSSRCRYVCGYI